MAEETKPAETEKTSATDVHGAALPKPYDEFEVGEHKIPWFLWLFFILIVSWASISWIQFFGY
ncbi:MAG TPA: hypothetical protein V6C99_06335 [Oculatellaceae cyanobacterium]|jgi:hypothetical protein